MKPTLHKIWAVVEVSLVTFGVIPLVTLALYRLFPRFETWQTETLGFPFAVFVYVVMIAVSLCIVVLRREAFAAYGITFQNARYHLDIAGTCFVPVVLANLPFGLGVDHTRWGGALILAVVQVALLFVLPRMLRNRPSAVSVGGLGAVSLWLPTLAGGSIGKALVLFLTYAFFVGFGEEILYRGYIHTRLNAVFGKPYTFFDVNFGWGSIIAAFVFGITHIGILRWMLGMSATIMLAWGFWTFFGGLVFGYVREKSGSILAPALLHGLPQAIATAVMLFV